MRMPEPRLRRLFSLGGASPKKRLKNSSRGSFEPDRGERCEAVEMLTTTGMVFLAMAAKEGGRATLRSTKIQGRWQALAAPQSSCQSASEFLGIFRLGRSRAQTSNFRAGFK